jgi:hypothetical protein
MIFDKYQTGTTRSPVECLCYRNYVETDGPDRCPLHNRTDGYLERVHRRLVRYITTGKLGEE